MRREAVVRRPGAAVHHDDALARPIARGPRLMHLRQEARFAHDGKGAAKGLSVCHCAQRRFPANPFGRLGPLARAAKGSG